MEYDENKFLELFDSVQIGDAERIGGIDFFLDKDYIITRGGLSFSLSVHSFEKYVIISLSSELQLIFFISMGMLEQIKCDGTTLTFYKSEKPYFIAHLGDQFSFLHDVCSEIDNKAEVDLGRIKGYDDFELLEVFDDADFVEDGKKIKNFYADCPNGERLTLSIDHFNNSVTLTLNDSDIKKPIFYFRFYHIARIIRAKDSVRFFKFGDEDECINMRFEPSFSIKIKSDGDG